MSKNKNFLLVSSSGGKNFSLALNLKDIIDSNSHLITKLINLELYKLPLYIHGMDTDNNFAKELSDEFTKADAFIFCAPEYNGGSPPILTNAITWVSLATDNWRGAFQGKLAIIGTHSGGDGFRFLSSFRSQLEHLGMIVVPKTISINNKKEFDIDSAHRTIQSLTNLL